jgi:hypothetical protein
MAPVWPDSRCPVQASTEDLRQEAALERSENTSGSDTVELPAELPRAGQVSSVKTRFFFTRFANSKLRNTQEKRMYKQSFNASSWSALALICGLLASPFAAAKCGCPDDGHGAPKIGFGLGETFPQAPDLAADPGWQVYEFERDGIRYVQINDASGTVRAVVGRVGDSFLVMPLGTDADRVLLPDASRPIGQAAVLVRTSDLLVAIRNQAGQAYWVIRAP